LTNTIINSGHRVSSLYLAQISILDRDFLSQGRSLAFKSGSRANIADQSAQPCPEKGTEIDFMPDFTMRFTTARPGTMTHMN
jgi:hypothetical protein